MNNGGFHLYRRRWKEALKFEPDLQPKDYFAFEPRTCRGAIELRCQAIEFKDKVPGTGWFNPWDDSHLREYYLLVKNSTENFNLYTEPAGAVSDEAPGELQDGKYEVTWPSAFICVCVCQPL